MNLNEEAGRWMVPMTQYVQSGMLSDDKKDARKVRVNATNYTMYKGRLYRKGYSTPWLKFLTMEEARNVIEEIHDGICGSHVESRAVVQKILRTWYIWPTMTKDTNESIQKCHCCQIHSNVSTLPSAPMMSISSPWPFMQWRIDIISPFPEAP